jgi:ABC-type multidrug transport system ATPase subunit
MKQLYCIKDLSFSVLDKVIINNVTCNINYNHITVINGHNGAGKTTLLKLLYGLYIPTSGYITRFYDKKNTNKAFFFQNSIFLNRSVMDNLKHALYCQNIKKIYWSTIINLCVQEYNVEYLLKLDIKSLSGGELQLLSLLRCILNSPDILFLDEPTNNLDTKNIEIIIDIIKSFHKKGCSIIMVSHDKNLLDMIQFEEMSLDRGKII